MKRIILTFVTVMLFSTNAQTKGTILLGAGSQLSETSWTDLAITQKLDTLSNGLALGAMIHFNTGVSTFHLMMVLLYLMQ